MSMTLILHQSFNPSHTSALTIESFDTLHQFVSRIAEVQRDNALCPHSCCKVQVHLLYNGRKNPDMDLSVLALADELVRQAQRLDLNSELAALDAAYPYVSGFNHP